MAIRRTGRVVREVCGVRERPAAMTSPTLLATINQRFLSRGYFS